MLTTSHEQGPCDHLLQGYRLGFVAIHQSNEKATCTVYIFCNMSTRI